MSSVANLAQVNFRFRTDGDLVDNTPTWGAAENTNYSIAVETNFRLRFMAQNTGTANATSPMVLRVSKNSGAYTAVTTTSGATLGAQSANAGSSADGDLIAIANFRLTAGTGTAGVGMYDETGSMVTTHQFGEYREYEFGLILKTAGAAAGNTFDFRLYNNTTAFTTYTRTPRVTCTVVDTEDDLLANDIVSASSVAANPALQQVHGILANDVTSPSNVTSPALGGAVKVASMMHNFRMRRA